MSDHDHALAQRTNLFGETIFSEITALAQKHGAVNLGQGFPDFVPPEFVLRAANAAVERTQDHQYARGAGHPELVQTLAERLEPSLGRPLDPLAEITITVGATEGLFAAALALIDPGDEVILFEPFYDSYPADVLISGGVPRYVPLLPDDDGRWGFDEAELRRAFSSRTKLIVVNTPHNPTGKVFTRAELELIAGLCQQHDALCLCDEVYEEIIFDGREHLRMATLDGMAERTLTVSSAGKTFSVTGWKIGWVVASPTLSAGLRKMHQWIPFAVATPLQLAVSQVLQEAGDYFDQLRAMYQGKRDRLVTILREAGLDPLVPEGTYFVVARTAALGWGADDVAFCKRLTEAHGVAAIPPSAFYSEPHRHLARDLARFCFCKEDQTLDEAGVRLGGLGGLPRGSAG